MFGGENPQLQMDDVNTTSVVLEYNRFVGDQICQSCHEAETKDWRQTRHSHAMDTLIKKDRQYDPECVRCHSTGYLIGGFRTIDLTPQMGNVQCEVCHGPGYLHAKEQNRLNMFRIKQKDVSKMKIKSPMRNTFSEHLCVSCHDEENDDNFVYSEKLPEISHGKLIEGLKSAD